MDRRDLFAFAVSVVLAGLLAFGWDWYTTPHDLVEATPSSVHFFVTWIVGFIPKLLPPIILGFLARTRIVFWSILLAILVVAIDESLAMHQMIYPQIAGKIIEYAIQYSFMALGAAYVRSRLPGEFNHQVQHLGNEL